MDEIRDIPLMNWVQKKILLTSLMISQSWLLCFVIYLKSIVLGSDWTRSIHQCALDFMRTSKMQIGHNILGPATEWIPHHLVDRSKLGHGNNGLPDHESGLFSDINSIEQLETGHVALKEKVGMEIRELV